MWHSIEILLPDPRPSADIGFADCDLTVVKSDPPMSHRRPKSLWQSQFDRLGDQFFHLGDPAAIKVRSDRYYVYDAFEPKQVRSEFDRFLPACHADFERIITRLCDASTTATIYVTVDVWLGPRPRTYVKPMEIAKFLAEIGTRGIRSN